MENQFTKTNKVLIGFSGGVDSAVSTILLKEQGYDVTAYYFNVLDNNDKALEEAKSLAKQLQIKLIYEDVKEEFNKIVINNFINEYLNGRTPNPCIICNPNIKFKKLIEVADKNEIKYIATGHYAKIINIDGKNYISRATNIKKDQSYMLYRLPKEIVDRIIFPLSDFESKEEIREIASNYSLYNSDKKDSQEICFTDNYSEFIEDKGFTSKRGDFIDLNNKVIGKHNGILYYTIGQRKGLGGTFGKPIYVVKIDKENNKVVLGDNSDLFTNKVTSIDNFFIYNDAKFYIGKDLKAKVRYSAPLDDVKIDVVNNEIVSTFINPQRAVTPGQSIVFYYKNYIVGGGFIK